MDMGKAGVARQADQRDRLAGRDPVALLDQQAAAPEMAVPGRPAVAMGDADRVAALVAGDRRAPDLGDADVGHAVADRLDHARRRSAHLDPARHDLEVADRDVGALVAIAGQPAAHVVPHPRAGIMVDVAHDPAILARLAVDRQAEPVRHPGLRRQPERQHRQERQ